METPRFSIVFAWKPMEKHGKAMEIWARLGDFQRLDRGDGLDRGAPRLVAQQRVLAEVVALLQRGHALPEPCFAWFSAPFRLLLLLLPGRGWPFPRSKLCRFIDCASIFRPPANITCASCWMLDRR